MRSLRLIENNYRDRRLNGNLYVDQIVVVQIDGKFSDARGLGRWCGTRLPSVNLLSASA